VGNSDEREYGSDTTREAAADDVEGHGILDSTSEGNADRSSDETEDVEAHGMIGAPTDAPTD
jgi:hypothetical protein